MQLAYGYGTATNSSWGPNMAKKRETKYYKKANKELFKTW